MGKSGYTRIFHSDGTELPKGWYYRPYGGGAFGPFSTERKARKAAGIT